METKARPRKLTTEIALRLGWSVERAGTWRIRRTSWPVATECGVTFTTEGGALAEVERRLASDFAITVTGLRRHVARLLS